MNHHRSKNQNYSPPKLQGIHLFHCIFGRPGFLWWFIFFRHYRLIIGLWKLNYWENNYETYLIEYRYICSMSYINQYKEQIAALCDKHNVEQLYIFGSALKNTMTKIVMLIYWWSLRNLILPSISRTTWNSKRVFKIFSNERLILLKSKRYPTHIWLNQ